MVEELVITIEDIPKIINDLYGLMPRCKVFTFEGPLGAGKTTIIRKLLEKCGINQPITSPTFTYVNVYENAQKELFYHFDLYRLHSVDDFIEAGFNEFLYLDNSWVFIEWPEIVMPLITKQMCNVKIDYYNDNKRIIAYKIVV